MENASHLKVLLITEGSGGHLIPAIEVASALAKSGTRVRLWYAKRPHSLWAGELLSQLEMASSIEVEPIAVASSSGMFGRLLQCSKLWRRASECFDDFKPDVIAGFGGWVCAPVVLNAYFHRVKIGERARKQRIGSIIHEQNVVMGKANRLLAPFVERIAVSFPETKARLKGVSSVVTGMPLRQKIGSADRSISSRRFNFSDKRPTVLVLGGSQGSHFINRLMTRLVFSITPKEREAWQVLHITGYSDEAPVRKAYLESGIAFCVTPFLVEMEDAYASSDLVLARAGASTIVELARCAKPSVLIPYPYAGAHQKANAKLVETLGGGLVIDEREASPQRVLFAMRRILSDRRLQGMMGKQVSSLDVPSASERLARAILELAGKKNSTQHQKVFAEPAIEPCAGFADAVTSTQEVRA